MKKIFGYFLILIQIFMLNQVDCFTFKNMKTIYINNIHRICFKSTTQTIKEECVNCLAARLQQTANSCLSQSTIPNNINEAQAKCLINACLQQIPGQTSQNQPVQITQQARKRRSLKYLT